MGSGKHANDIKSKKPCNQKLKSLNDEKLKSINEDSKSKNDLLNSQLDEQVEQSPKLLDLTHKTEGYVAPNEQMKTLIKSVNLKHPNYSIRKSLINNHDKEVIVQKADTISKPISINISL